MGLRDQILAADDLPREAVPVPEWGNVTVYVRTLTGAERDAFESGSLKGKGKNRDVNLANVRARLCCAALCDEGGKRLFEDDEADALGKKSSKALDRIFAVAQRLNGTTDEDVEGLAKN